MLRATGTKLRLVNTDDIVQDAYMFREQHVTISTPRLDSD